MRLIITVVKCESIESQVLCQRCDRELVKIRFGGNFYSVIEVKGAVLLKNFIFRMFHCTLQLVKYFWEHTWFNNVEI